jgi:putative polyhydroxyalkanoate system protein
MSTISIRREHSLSRTKILGVAKSVAAELKKEYGIESSWSDDTLQFERSGLSGMLRLTPKELLLDVRLGVLLFAMRDTIARQIERKLDQLLPVEPPKSSRTRSTAR